MNKRASGNKTTAAGPAHLGIQCHFLLIKQMPLQNSICHSCPRSFVQLFACGLVLWLRNNNRTLTDASWCDTYFRQSYTSKVEDVWWTAGSMSSDVISAYITSSFLHCVSPITPQSPTPACMDIISTWCRHYIVYFSLPQATSSTKRGGCVAYEHCVKHIWYMSSTNTIYSGATSCHFRIHAMLNSFWN